MNGTITIDIALRGVVRKCEVFGDIEGSCGPFHTKTPVLVKFPTGAKVHKVFSPVVFRRADGTYHINAYQYCHNRNVAVIGWADESGGSGWNY